MNREEILARSQRSKDEGLIEAQRKGQILGIAIMFVILLTLYLYSFIFLKTREILPAFQALIWAYLASAAIPEWKFTGRRTYLLTIILGYILTIMNIISFFMNTWGWWH